MTAPKNGFFYVVGIGGGVAKLSPMFLVEA
jgi:hypothetical protein